MKSAIQSSVGVPGTAMLSDIEGPLNIYVGCEPPQRLAARVLESSIRRHASLPVQVHRLDERVGDRGLAVTGRTMFSLQRFFIPELNHYRGLAVYVDSDMLVFRDIRELLALHVGGSAVTSAVSPPESGRRPQFSVMVIDCELAEWNPLEILRSAQSNYGPVLYELDFERSKTPGLPYQWNSLERYEPGQTCLLHFTDMNVQPWVSLRNPLAPVWMDALFQALDDGFIGMDDILDSATRGWIRPGIVWQTERRERDPAKLPLSYKLKEAFYQPPHKPPYWARRRQQLLRIPAALHKRLARSSSRSAPDVR